MTELKWAGVMPAITTPFLEDHSIDHDFLRVHVDQLIGAGVTAIVPCGFLGEGAALSFGERVESMMSCREAAAGRVPVIPGIAATSAAEAVELAREAERAGCGGLMVLPPYVHRGPWREYETFLDAVIGATSLECMLKNDPPAHGVDVTPERIVEFAARHENLRAVEESSGDVRRITAVKALAGDRLDAFAGLDDMVVEAVRMGASGWVAGLVNALPVESVRLFRYAAAGDTRADALYAWFLPLLRFHVVPESVQLIKLVQAQCGLGTERVRPPRRPVDGTLREEALAAVRAAFDDRPELD